MLSSALINSLHTGLEGLPPGALVVAFSGGMDSSTLLHALAQSTLARTRGLRAVHVDHGLHADSARWAQHCRAFAADLGIELTIVEVRVALAAGAGPEDTARRARRSAYLDRLALGEILALAHHADDQAETILLKLLRGAGPEGLAGMRTLRKFGKGQWWRPWLGAPRSALAEYARAHDLRWVDDPSNIDTRLSRNFLRHEILPRLTRRWPEAPIALAHSATWARAAADFIGDEAQRALTRIQGADPATLAWQPWLELHAALRDPVLRLWLRQLGLTEPAHFHVTEIERQLHEAAADRLPSVRWPGAEIRRYRELLYAAEPHVPVQGDWETSWDGTMLTLPGGGTLALHGRTNAGVIRLPSPLQVRYRRGGERLRPAGHAHTRELRLLLQEAGIPPWLRDQIPLVYINGELAAAGDLFVGESARDLYAQHDAGLVWTRALAKH